MVMVGKVKGSSKGEVMETTYDTGPGSASRIGSKPGTNYGQGRVGELRKEHPNSMIFLGAFL